jgi:iron(III) transport system ATP-binding protein
VQVPPEKRGLSMVFQSYAIWPHMTVFDNVAYPLTVQRIAPGKGEIRDRTMQALALVGMDGMADRSATRLSGGQQQRVALARAVVRRPKLLLLDEPLSNLDARLREAMREELSEMIARIRVTALYVTHDQAEGFALAHRVAVMNQGRIIQEGAPRAIYAEPRTVFTATFLGAANILLGRIESVEQDKTALIAIDGGAHLLALQTACIPGEAVDVVIRPEDLVVSATKIEGLHNVLTGKIVRVVFLGGAVEYHVDIGAKQLLRKIGRPVLGLDAGVPVWIGFDPRHSTVLSK